MVSFFKSVAKSFTSIGQILKPTQGCILENILRKKERGWCDRMLPFFPLPCSPTPSQFVYPLVSFFKSVSKSIRSRQARGFKRDSSHLEARGFKRDTAHLGARGFKRDVAFFPPPPSEYIQWFRFSNPLQNPLQALGKS